MEDNKLLNYIKDILTNMPNDWLRLTTHRLDIYNEELAKTEFIQQLKNLFNAGDSSTSSLAELPTAYDYIRLGHPLSSVMEWFIGTQQRIPAQNVISFSSRTMPIMAILRNNLLEHNNTLLAYTGSLPESFEPETVKRVYGYSFELKQVESINDLDAFDGSVVFISEQEDIFNIELSTNVDFFISANSELGSILIVNSENNRGYISEIQHVRRRETIAMTPANCYAALKRRVDESVQATGSYRENKESVIKSITEITGANTDAVIGSSGLSIQYAITMGLIHYALDKHNGKDIKFVVPPNCYGGTNDQARRVAACIGNVEVVDLPVDGDHNMVDSIDTVLDQTRRCTIYYCRNPNKSQGSSSRSRAAEKCSQQIAPYSVRRNCN